MVINLPRQYINKSFIGIFFPVKKEQDACIQIRRKKQQCSYPYSAKGVKKGLFNDKVPRVCNDQFLLIFFKKVSPTGHKVELILLQRPSLTNGDNRRLFLEMFTIKINCFSELAVRIVQ